MAESGAAPVVEGEQGKPTPRVGRPARRAFISERTNVRRARILEIGALDSPTFPERNVRYLDWFSREELLAAIAGNERRLPDRLVEVDHVVKDKRFARHISVRFDVVIANHVIEHVADPVTWLRQVSKLTPSGELFLAVPDRRYTFDYLRPVSTAGQLMRAYQEDLDQPSQWQYLDALFYWRPFRAAHAWAEDFTPLGRPRFSFEEALERSKRAALEYVDTHCHVFSADSFGALMDDLSGITGWTCVEVSEVAEGANEFHAWLRPVT